MPSQWVARLNQEVRRALQSPEGQAELAKQNMETFDWDAATFTKYVQSEIEHWGPYVRESQEK